MAEAKQVILFILAIHSFTPKIFTEYLLWARVGVRLCSQEESKGDSKEGKKGHSNPSRHRGLSG